MPRKSEQHRYSNMDFNHLDKDLAKCFPYQGGLTEEAKETPCLQATMETFLGTACHSQSVLADCLLIHSLNQKIHPATFICVFPARDKTNCPASYLTATPPLVHQHTSPFSYSRPDQFSALLLRSPSRFSIIPINIPLL